MYSVILKSNATCLFNRPLTNSGSTTTVNISLNTAAAATLTVSNYAATVFFTNLATGAIQGVPFAYQSTPLVIKTDKRDELIMPLAAALKAFDPKTGKELWKFYTVPGDPSKPFESPAMK